MLRASTTVIAVVAPPGASPLESFEANHAKNVRLVQTDSDADGFSRAREAIEQANKTTAPYLVHDADPLVDVAKAWVEWFDRKGPAGDLEIAVAEAVARWRSGSIDLPDYYVLVDPQELEATAQHWYLGFLAEASHNRVVAARSDLSIAAQLKRLRAGRWWPDLDVLLARAAEVVPDHVGVMPAESDGQRLVIPEP